MRVHLPRPLNSVLGLPYGWAPDLQRVAKKAMSHGKEREVAETDYIMAKAKKKLLPKNFVALLAKADLAELKAVFDVCDVNARGGYGKQTALAFDMCPDAFSRWLVAQGADLSATDTWGNTPLHQRGRSCQGCIGVLLELGADVNSTSSSIGTPLHAAAYSYNAENARLMLEHGACVDALNKERLTPLELALRGCENINLEGMVSLAKGLLNAGEKKTPRMKDFVEEIGKCFEFHRSGFNSASVDAASTALDQLYEIFDVPPVPRRELHDGKSSITVKTKTWQEQNQELWDALVPSSGQALTVQGELVRCVGKLTDEAYRNGNSNWAPGSGHELMLNFIEKTILADQSVALQRQAKIRKDIMEIKDYKHPNLGGSGTCYYNLTETVVDWCIQHPAPIPREIDPKLNR